MRGLNNESGMDEFVPTQDNGAHSFEPARGLPYWPVVEDATLRASNEMLLALLRCISKLRVWSIACGMNEALHQCYTEYLSPSEVADEPESTQSLNVVEAALFNRFSQLSHQLMDQEYFGYLALSDVLESLLDLGVNVSEALVGEGDPEQMSCALDVWVEESIDGFRRSQDGRYLKARNDIKQSVVYMLVPSGALCRDTDCDALLSALRSRIWAAYNLLYGHLTSRAVSQAAERKMRYVESLQIHLSLLNQNPCLTALTDLLCCMSRIETQCGQSGLSAVHEYESSVAPVSR